MSSGIRHSAIARRGIAILCVAVALGPTARIAAQSDQRPVFRAGTSVVSVDVTVRDAAGEIVRGLTAGDFVVTEDGRPQQIQTFTFQEVADRPPATEVAPDLLADIEQRLRDDVRRAPGTAAAAPAPAPLTGSAFAGRRLIVLLFDISSMQPEDVQRAVDSGQQYVDEQMSGTDLVAVVTIGTAIDVLTDFTAETTKVREALQQIAYSDGTATPPPEASTVTTDDAQAASDADATDETGFDAFNNDVRLRALKTLAETLAPVEQKKAILYFSAGLERSGDDNQVELRAAINAAVRGNVAIYPVDARGLQAVPPGGDASRASRGGVGLFSGRNVERQFTQLNASQETLTTLAADTGGQAFTDANDFGPAFARVQRDLSAYYLIGYASTNAVKDGRFRRIQVRVASRRGLRVEARAGYYAERDFAHSTRTARESDLDDQLAAAVSSTDVPLVVGAGWFRQTGDRFYVPIALAIPGSAVPVAPGATKVTLDVRGVVRDEQGRQVGRVKETLDVPAGDAPTLAGKQVLYQAGVTLPPGRFAVKVVVRENTTGAIGSFETAIAVPQLKETTLNVSSVVLSTQLQPAPRGAGAGNPLVRDGVQLLPNLTRVVGKEQRVYFYYEVYDPALADSAPDLRTSLAFYRGATKVYETPLVERQTVDEPGRKAVVFQFEIAAGALAPGAYTCQINVIDTVAGRVAFPRVSFLVH